MREMKDSGIEWLGNIPSDWKCCRTKDQYYKHKDIVGINYDKYERLALTLKGVIKRSKEDLDGLQPESFTGYQILKAGDLVFKLIDLENISTSRVGLSEYKGLVSPAYIALTPKDNAYARFGKYYFLSMWHREIFNHLGDEGVRSSLSATDLLNIPYICPKKEEQKDIADFLDKKCVEIDSLTSDIQKQIDTLEQYKKSTITEAVTKGLDPDVTMKDSGIDWVGRIPSSWIVHPVYYFFAERKNKNKKGTETNLLSLSYGRVIRKDINTNEGLLPESFNTYNIVEANDIIIRPTDLQNDKRSLRTGLVKEHGIITSAYIDLKPKGFEDTRYFHYLLHSFDVMKVFYNMGNGVRQGLNYSEFSRLMIFAPPMEEQKQIADYLDKKITEIDVVISDKKEELSMLESYKKSLIYEYVTGKKEV